VGLFCRRWQAVYNLYNSDAPLLVRRLVTCNAAAAAADLAQEKPIPASLAVEVGTPQCWSAQHT
jgi:hypothetical protein